VHVLITYKTVNSDDFERECGNLKKVITNNKTPYELKLRFINALNIYIYTHAYLFIIYGTRVRPMIFRFSNNYRFTRFV